MSYNLLNLPSPSQGPRAPVQPPWGLSAPPSFSFNSYFQVFDSFQAGFYLWFEIRVQIHCFACGYPVVFVLFVEKIYFPPLNGLSTLFKKSVDRKCMVLFWALSSIPLIYMSVLMPGLHCLDYCISILSFKIGKCKSSSYVLFQDCFGYSGPLHFHMNFRFRLSVFAKKYS